MAKPKIKAKIEEKASGKSAKERPKKKGLNIAKENERVGKHGDGYGRERREHKKKA